jgi:hypothetical protein
MSVVQLPTDTVEAVRRVADRLVEEILAAVRAENPVYAEVLGDPEGVGLRLGIDQAVKSFLDAIERGELPASETGEIWRRLGEAEFQSGRSLDAVRAAFRTGVRAAWRGAAELANESGVPTHSVIALAEAIFVYADELTNDVVEGYLRIQSDEAGERERRRRRLAALLLDADGYDPEAIGRAAELAHWPIPRSLAVLVLPGDSPGAVSRRLDLDVLAGSDQGGSFLVIPDPDGPGRGASLRRAVGSETAALGPAVAPREAYRSLRWARMALDVAPREGGLVRAVDHLGTIMLRSDEQIAEAFAQLTLKPLLDLPAPERERLLETLRAWLDHQRHTPRVAAELHVHPQTVRYRIAKLRELLGDVLETPDGRFELQMALRVPRA